MYVLKSSMTNCKQHLTRHTIDHFRDDTFTTVTTQQTVLNHPDSSYSHQAPIIQHACTYNRKTHKPIFKWEKWPQMKPTHLVDHTLHRSPI